MGIKQNLFLILILLISQFSFGQINIRKMSSVSIPKTNKATIQKRNQQMGYKTPQVPPSDPLKAHEFILNQAKAYKPNQQKSKAETRKIINELATEAKRKTFTPKYELPSFQNIPATAYYKNTFEKLTALKNNSFSVKDANLLVENAYLENKINQSEFDKTIKGIGSFLRKKMKELDYEQNDNLSKNLILLQLFSDTLKIKSTGQEHFPVKYNFNDYLSNNDWANMFVSKLIKSNIGQCHSMPLLYLILAEEIGAKAYLSFSPNHFYIKFEENKKWYNVELTSGILTTDAFILQSGYIKAEALQNKIYMNSLNNNQLLSQLMVDLAQGYTVKFGYDSFVEEIINEALKLYPKNINANMMLVNYRIINFQYIQKQLNINPQNIHKYPRAKILLDKIYAQSKIVDDLGFAKMPTEAYAKWLESLGKAQKKQESESMILNLNRLIKSKQ